MSPRADPRRVPISIYEVDAASWDRDAQGRSLGWAELAERLIPYVADLGFTHLGLIPMADEAGFAALVDAAHHAGLGVLLDWAPAAVAVGGDVGQPDVQRALVDDALRWIGEQRVDGLRIAAIASLLYRDYGRKGEAWLRGGTRWDAVELLRAANRAIHAEHPRALTIGEESTAWPCVTNPTHEGGLGFDFKWNLGWRYDTLRYFERNADERREHHAAITVGSTYAYAENFILPLSHETVADQSLLTRMAGDDWQQFANLRALYGVMWAHPGKKLLFMGQEFAQRRGWDPAAALDWGLVGNHAHDGVLALVRDLNRLYRDRPALHARDCEIDGFAWPRRTPGAAPIAVVANLTPIARAPYRVPLPAEGRWREILNTDAAVYGGTNLGNRGGAVAVEGAAWITLPPLATIMVEWEG